MTDTNTAMAEAFATEENVLPSRQTTLIGLYGPSDALRAMVRMPGGRIRHVSTGDRLPLGRVMGIDTSGLLIDVHGKTERLPLLAG